MIVSMAQQTLDRRPAAPARRRGVTFWIGIGLVLAGLGGLASVAGQFFGTNVVSHHKQRQIVEQTRRDWDSEPGDTVSAKPVNLHGAMALIRIPKFGKKYVMPVQEGTSDAVLAEGFGHVLGTAGPGEVGNFAVSAHRVTHGEPLRHMPDLRPGDKVIVETKTFTYTYVLDTNPNDLVISFTGTWVIDPVRPHNPDSNSPKVNPIATSDKLITL